MNKAYTNWITWVNYPSTESPINETALNLLSNAVDAIDDRVVAFDTTKANQSDLLQAIKAISFNQSTGTFVFTLFNNNTITIDTDIDKVAVNFDYDDDPTSQHYQSLILTLSDGTIKYIDLSALITQYEFDDTSTIHANVSSVSGHVSFNVIDGSITASKLDPAVLASVQASVAAAEAHMLNSQAWAEGKKGSTDVSPSDPQYNRHSKYFANLSEGYSQDSEAWAVGTRNGQPVPTTDPTYNNSAKHWAEEAASAVASSDGHQIVNPSGSAMTQRKKLQFTGNVSVSDDDLNGRTVVTVDGMTILSYGHSTWSDFINAYNGNRVVYCRASSSSNPGSGSQTRLAFMAYVNNESSPTEVEFQYYRTVSNHTSTPGDQIFVYKLTSSNGGTWTVTTRNVYTVANEVYYSNNNTVKDVLDSNIGTATFTVATSAWVSNSGSDATDFPYIAELTTSDYDSNFMPSEVFLVGAVATDYPTSAERDEISKVDVYVKFTGTAIRLRATDSPITVLNLLVKR